MLGKVLKYDLKWIYKLIVVFYILGLIFAGLSRVFLLVDNSLLFNILYKVFSSASIAMLFSAVINTLMRSWVRFVNNSYKDESYLTHTLPIEKKTIFLSKVLSAIIVSFTTILVILLCLFICYYSKENMEALKGLLQIAATSYETSEFKLIGSLSIIVFLELLFILFVGYVGIIIGHKSNSNKIVKSIIYGFALYMGTSMVSLGLLFGYGLFDKNVMNLINTTSTVEISAIKGVLLFASILYVIYNIVYYFVGNYLFNKGVNVD